MFKELPELTGLRILIVEDIVDFADELAETLQGWCLEVVGPVGSVRDALVLIEGEEIHGALLDVILGAEKVFPLAAELSARNIPFLFMSGYSTLPDFPHELKAVPWIIKPVDPAALAAAMFETFCSLRMKAHNLHDVLAEGTFGEHELEPTGTLSKRWR
jgi:DNA-binding NtrC family response regulator